MIAAWPLLLAAVTAPEPVVSGAWTFTDVTAAAGISAPHGYLGGHLSQMNRIIAGGVAVGDYDADGWDDLYLVTGDLGLNRLFRNNGDGTFDDRTVAAGVGLPGALNCGPTFADYDGDGHVDLFVGGIDGTSATLFRNLGDETFQDVTVASGISLPGDTFSATFGDPDRDGDLDLFTTHWGQPAGPGHFWRNEGDGTFQESDLLVGFVDYDDDGTDRTFTGNFCDIDGDAWPDLVVASDFETSQVYQNDGDGTFTRTTTSVISDENGMGAAVGDYDNDGDIDWFVSSVWDPVIGPGPRGIGGVSGNRLYRNLGDGMFEDVTDSTGVRRGYWGWGSSFADLNNDGHLDLYHVNGWVAPRFVDDPARFYLSNGDGTFTESSEIYGIDHPGQGRGLACLDYDRDGDLDLLIANNSETPVLYRNDGGNANHWLRVRLAGSSPNLLAVGAKIRVELPGMTLLREVNCGNNFASQNSVVAHFGLGGATIVDQVVVDWPDGTVTSVHGLAANQAITLFPTASAVKATVDPGSGLRIVAYPNPFASRATLRFQIPRRADVTVRLLDAHGRHVRELSPGVRPAGSHLVTWDALDDLGRPVAPGVYLYVLRAGGETRSGKITLLR